MPCESHYDDDDDLSYGSLYYHPLPNTQLTGLMHARAGAGRLWGHALDDISLVDSW